MTNPDEPTLDDRGKTVDPNNYGGTSAIGRNSEANGVPPTINLGNPASAPARAVNLGAPGSIVQHGVRIVGSNPASAPQRAPNLETGGSNTAGALPRSTMGRSNPVDDQPERSRHAGNTKIAVTTKK